MEFTFVKGEVKPHYDGKSCDIILTVEGQKHAVNEYYSVMQGNDKPMIAKVSVKRNKRSLDANAYFWVLCGKIADKTMQIREDVYKEMIVKNGVYADILVHNEKAHKVIKSWQKTGIGWFTEYVRESK